MGREVRRNLRRSVDGNSSAISSVPVNRGLRAAHSHGLVVRPGEAAVVAGKPLQGTAGEIT
jgi:hypothetical protein